MVRYETSYFTCTCSAYTTVYRHIFLSVILFLKSCLRDCKVLNISFAKKQIRPKETNRKQKFQKPLYENICSICLNGENLYKQRVEPNLFELYRRAAKFR